MQRDRVCFQKYRFDGALRVQQLTWRWLEPFVFVCELIFTYSMSRCICFSPVGRACSYLTAISRPGAPHQVLNDRKRWIRNKALHVWAAEVKDKNACRTPAVCHFNEEGYNLPFQSCEHCPGKSSHIFPWEQMVEHPKYGLHRDTGRLQEQDSPIQPTTFMSQTCLIVPVLSMEFERRYDPSELRLSPVTESPCPCML